MRNNYKFYIFLLAIPVMALFFLSYSGGQVSPYSGSPGDGGSTCAVCHSGTTDHSAVATITTNIPDDGYLYNEDYTITVSVTSDVSKHGFQATAEKDGGTKVGSFTAGTGSQTNSSNSLVTHNSAGNSLTEWSFTWTSPATSEGDITFYTAVNATNSNSMDSGDQVVLTNTAVAANTTGIATLGKIDFSVFPNPTSDYLQLSLSDEYESTTYSITDYQGKQIIKDQLLDNNTVNVSSLTSGVYFLQIISDDKMGVVRFVKK